MNNTYIPDGLSFEQKQMMAYTFLSAFYTREELGYSVDRYSYTDVTQEIIDIVNTIGKDFITSNRIIQVANLLKTLVEPASKVEFLIALFGAIVSKDVQATFESIFAIGMNKLIAERDTIKKNFWAYNLMKQILNREKGNIELKFNGF